jgi:hypothetical protein
LRAGPEDGHAGSKYGADWADLDRDGCPIWEEISSGI